MAVPRSSASSIALRSYAGLKVSSMIGRFRRCLTLDTVTSILTLLSEIAVRHDRAPARCTDERGVAGDVTEMERSVADDFDPYYTWLGIRPEEQPADHYRLIGLRQFEDNAEVIANAADRQMQFLRSMQVGKRSTQSQKLLNEISAARGCLLDPQRQAAYDKELKAKEFAKAQATKAAAPKPRPLPKTASLQQTPRPAATAVLVPLPGPICFWIRCRRIRMSHRSKQLHPPPARLFPSFR